MRIKILCVLFGLSAVMGIARADGLDDLTGNRVTVQLDNSSGYTIREIYLSPTSWTNWGRDLLGSGQLHSGYRETIEALPGTYDLRLVDTDGDDCILFNIQVRADRAITITRDALLRCERNS